VRGVTAVLMAAGDTDEAGEDERQRSQQQS
jgi:hypothetical protein